MACFVYSKIFERLVEFITKFDMKWLNFLLQGTKGYGKSGHLEPLIRNFSTWLEASSPSCFTV